MRCLSDTLCHSEVEVIVGCGEEVRGKVWARADEEVKGVFWGIVCVAGAVGDKAVELRGFREGLLPREADGNN